MVPADSGSLLSLETILEKVSALTLQIQQEVELEEILQGAILDSRTLLQADRVLIYASLTNEGAVITHESIVPEWSPLLGRLIYDPCLQEAAIDQYRQGQITAISDVRAEGLPACCAKLFEQLQVQASLAVPICTRNSLWGFLIAHQCRSPREWQPLEVQYVRQVALQLGIAVQQATLQQSQQQLMTELNDRKQSTDQALQNSESRLSLALKAAKAGMWQWDLVTGQTFWTEQNYRLLGYSPQIHQPSYENWLNAVHPDDREAVDRFVIQSLNEKRECHTEYRVLLPDQQVRWCADIGEFLYDADGNPTSMIGIQLDITERKQAELAIQQLNQELEHRVQQRTIALQQSEARWQFALEGAGDGVWDWNVQDHRVFLSRQWKAMLGYAEHEVGEPLAEWANRVHPDDRAKCNADLAAHFSGKTPIYQNEHRIRCQDGSYKWVLARGKVFEWTAEGKPLRMIGTQTDIDAAKHREAERKQAEEQLQTLSNRLKIAVEAAHMGIWDWDLATDRLVIDDRTRELYGIPPSDSDAETYAAWEARLHPDDLPVCQATMQQSIANKTPIAFEFRVILPDGTLRYLESYARVLLDSEGVPVRIIGVDFDISDRKRVEAERKAAEAALREQQQFTEQIAESTLAILYIYDLDEQRNVYCSQQVELVLGYSSAEIQAMGDALFALLVHPDDLPKVIQNQQKTLQLQDNEFIEAEYRMRHKTGDYRWLLGRDRILNRTAEGNSRQVVGVAVDITALKEFEATLHQQAERERLLMTIAQNIRKTLDLEQILHTAVTEVRRLLQVDRVSIYRFETHSGIIVAESVAEGWRSLLGTQINDARLIGTQRKSYLQGQSTAVDDIYSASLSPRHVEVMERLQVRAELVVPILQNEHLWGLLIAHHCQAARHWEPFEIALQQQLATQIAIAIYQSELHQQVQTLNAELELQVQERTAQLQQSLDFEELLKRITDKVRDSLDEQQILQTVVEELAYGLLVEACDTGIYNAEQTVCTIAYEFTNTLSPIQGSTFEIASAPHSEVYPFLFQGMICQFCGLASNSLRGGQQSLTILACPIRDEKGVLGEIWLFKPSQVVFNELEVRLVQQVANQCAIALRQSRLYQATQQQVQELERLNQLKDDFLSTVSHELRTPMSNIRMATQMLEISLDRLGVLADESDPVYRYFNVLRVEGQREISLINDLLDLARLDAGTEPLSFTSINLQYYIPHVAETFAERAQQQQQQLLIQIPPDLPVFTTDLPYLERILNELLNNACKYTPSGETIALTAQAIAERLQIRISNSGVEIPPAERERIFDKFYRIPNSDPWKYGGTGLGLALVKKLVQRLGGNIRIESIPGETSFILEFDCAQPEPPLPR